MNVTDYYLAYNTVCKNYNIPNDISRYIFNFEIENVKKKINYLDIIEYKKFMANFDKTIKPVKPMLGVDINFNTEVARSILKYDPVPIKKTIKDTSDYIKSYS